MRKVAIAVLLIPVLVLPIVPVRSQTPAAGPGQEMVPVDEALKMMDVPPATAALVRALATNGKADPAAIMAVLSASGSQGANDLLPLLLMLPSGGGEINPLLLLALASTFGEGSGSSEDLLGLMLMSGAMRSPSAPAVVAVRYDNGVLVIADGKVYKVNTMEMRVEGVVSYKPEPETAAPPAIPRALLNMLLRAREKARETSCMSNLRQLANAALAYAEDYDEVYPLNDWDTSTQLYVRNAALLSCPSAPGISPAYAMNRALVGADSSRVVRPAETVLLFESDPTPGQPAIGGPENAVARHRGGLLLAFADGHVKWYSLADAQRLLGKTELGPPGSRPAPMTKGPASGAAKGMTPTDAKTKMQGLRKGGPPSAKAGVGPGPVPPATRGAGGEPAAAIVGKTAPDFTLESLDGGKVKLSDHKGKDVVVLDFWATWCAPCRQAMPVVLKVAEAYKGKGVVLYAVNVREDADKVQAFMDETGLKPNVLLDKTGSVAGDYGAEVIPYLVIIARDGTIACTHIGFSAALEDNLLKAALDRALQAAATTLSSIDLPAQVTSNRLQQIVQWELTIKIRDDGNQTLGTEWSQPDKKKILVDKVIEVVQGIDVSQARPSPLDAFRAALRKSLNETFGAENTVDEIVVTKWVTSVH